MKTIIRYAALSVLTLFLVSSAIVAQKYKLSPKKRTVQPAPVYNYDHFYGQWMYKDELGDNKYMWVHEIGGGYVFVDGFETNGVITWAETIVNKSGGIYLTPSKGKLVGRFISPNF